MKTKIYFLAVMTAAASMMFADQETLLPATQHLKITETDVLLIENREALENLVSHPMKVNPEIVKVVTAKLTPFIGKSLYPSTLAHLLFELAFTDGEKQRLTPQQRTQNMGYILSNLGSNNPEVVEKLYAFYYGYCFEHFAKK